MIFTETRLTDVWLIETEPARDERGSFTRVFCQKEFERHDLDGCVAQSSVSFNRLRGTIRGLHYQDAPHAETKLVRVSRGAVYDVAVDLRPDSPTFRRWVAYELSADNGRMLYVGKGLAHGFQTLCDDTELTYQMSTPFEPGAYRGLRFDDPAIGVEWPLAPRALSERDLGHPALAR